MAATTGDPAAHGALQSLISQALQLDSEARAALSAQLSEAAALLSAPTAAPPGAAQVPATSPTSGPISTSGSTSTRRVTPGRNRGSKRSGDVDLDQQLEGRRTSESLLTGEVLHAVFSHLDASALNRAMCVCKVWRSRARDERLWMWMYLRHGSGLPRPQHLPSSWRAEYYEQMRLRANWLSGRCLVSRLSGHKEAVNCFDTCGDIVVSGADDNDLRVWDLGCALFGTTERHPDDACTQVLTGHTGKVLCCCIVRGMVVSGGEDRVVFVWDLKTGKQRGQMRQHTSAVLCMVTDGSRYVYTGGGDYELCKWSVDSLQCEGIMRKHRSPILCICLGCDDGFVITGSRDRDACVWNTSNAPTAACTYTLSGHDAAVTCVHASRAEEDGGRLGGAGGIIVTGSDDKTVRVWSSASGSCLKVVGEHQGPLSDVVLQGGLIMTACFDGKVRVIDVVSGRLLRTVPGHRNAVLTMDARGRIVVTGGNDRDLRVWDLEERAVAPSPQVQVSANRVTVQHGYDKTEGGEGGEDCKLGYALSGHNSGIQKVCIVGQRIITASDDYELRVWDFARWPKKK